MTDRHFTMEAAGRRVELGGELDLESSQEMAALLGRLVDGGGDVTVDLSAVTFVDSTALGALVNAHARLAAAGGRLVVVEPSPTALRLLQLLDLEGLLIQHPEV